MGLPPTLLLPGELVSVANELRDSYRFMARDGKRYLLYVGAGEQAIGIATLE